MSKYLNLNNYMRYAFALVNGYFLEPLETWLSPDVKQPLRHPPIFFLGAPRSGSTLAIQVITDVLDVGYISNKHCQWYGAPALAEHIFHPTKHRPSSDYESNHGETLGDFAPAECGEWWYRFFRRNPAYVTLDDVDPRRMRQFRRSVAALTEAFDRPIVFKNLYASLRTQAIAHYLPESLFVVIHRNEIDNGQSILEARYKQFQDYSHWFSITPPEVDKLMALPAHQQVIEQIRHIHKTIDGDMHKSSVKNTRRFDFLYEDFCDNPSALIEKIEIFLRSNGCIVKRRAKAPEKFIPRNCVRIDSVLYEQMVTYSNESRAW